MISTHAPLAGRDLKDDLTKYKADAEFQPTRPLRGATTLTEQISQMNGISTHAPLAGRDNFRNYKIATAIAFQPTRPLRGATSTYRIRRCRL